jgi:hypothetical protein
LAMQSYVRREMHLLDRATVERSWRMEQAGWKNSLLSEIPKSVTIQNPI